MNLARMFVDRPVATMMLFIAILAVGLFSLYGLPVDLFPEIEPPIISVVTQYYGASAKDVESNITKLLESSLSSVNKLDKITSISIDNTSAIQLQFDWGTNLDEAANDIRNTLELTKSQLPEEVETPIIFKFGTNFFPVLFISVTAEESYLGLNKLAEEKIADPIKRVPGVGTVITFGGPIRQIQVGIDPKRLEAYNIDIQRVAAALAGENITLPAGSIKMGLLEYNVRVPGEFADPRQIGDIVVAQQANRLVHLRDVATVKDTLKERTIRTRMMGGHGLQMVVQKQSGANTVRVANDVRAKLSELQKKLPSDVKLNIVMDSSEFITNSVRNLANAVLLGGLFVILVVLIFLREWRNTIIISLTIPFSLIVAFIYLYVSGNSLNIISLSSLSIAVGLVVDDAIVILENITRHVESGARPREASIFGSSEVGLAVTAATFTIVAVFFPMVFLSGISGVFFNQIGALVTITILTSLFASLTLIPMLTSKLLKRPKERKRSALFGKLYDTSELWFVKLENFYHRILNVALHRRKLVIILAVIIFISSLGLKTFVGSEFMPEHDSNSLVVDVELQSGTRLEESMATAAKIERIIKNEIPEIEYYSVRAGVNDQGWSSIIFGQKEGSNIISVMNRLISKVKRNRSVFEIADILRERLTEFPDITRFSINTSGGGAVFMGVTGKQIEVDVVGFDLEETGRIANQVVNIMSDTPGAVDVAIATSEGRPELDIELDREKLSTLGLNTAIVAKVIRQSIYGTVATKYREGGDEYDIFVRYEPSYRKTITDLENIPIRTFSGQVVKVKDIGKVVETLSPPEIRRKNQERVITVGANVSGRPTGDVTDDIKSRLNKLYLPPGVNIEYSGQVEQQSESFRDLTLFLILSLFLVFVIMAAQFESLLDPFVIMFSVPFAFVGVLWGLFLTGITLSVISFLAVIMLVGIVTKNAIVLVDYINILRARGLSLFEAIVRAGRNRLRPVLMTTITTILGMTPLVIGTGEGSEIWRPLGVTVISGLTISTLVTLVLVPVIYSIFETRFRKPRQRT